MECLSVKHTVILYISYLYMSYPQVRAANSQAQQAVRYGEQLRERLGQDWIPKVQGWWEGVSKQADASKVSGWCQQCAPLHLLAINVFGMCCCT